MKSLLLVVEFPFFYINVFNREEDYPHTLSMYRNPPAMNISLQDFETFAYQRAKGQFEFKKLIS